MLSIVLYGRNDNYGYNLHKRAALSLNCMAEVLNDPEDEVLFVDYNTPDDYPTFPEAIQDTLTDKAKRVLRIFRVRPSLHERFRAKSQLLALEPVSRNVAVRRSNPANRWILSTNTDMIFVPRRHRSLNDIVAPLAKGYYGAPRLEIPETLWETFDRLDPVGTIDLVSRLGWQFHMNEIVLGFDFFKFDGPGDFQLIERADLFAMNGFHESMLLGWHVDANIAKRLNLMYGKIGELTDEVFGYHCDHTRQITPAHRKDSVQNDTEDFVHSVIRPDVPAQAETWGCPQDDIEEVRLGRSKSNYRLALEETLRTPQRKPIISHYTGPSYDKTDYSPEHVLPFLLDLYAPVAPGHIVAWFGGNAQMFSLFAEAAAKAVPGVRILVPKDLASYLPETASFGHVETLALEDVVERAESLVFDYGTVDGSKLTKSLTQANRSLFDQTVPFFWDALAHEHARLHRGKPPRRFIGIGCIHNRFEQLFANNIGIAKSPFSLKIRQGFAYPTDLMRPVSWMPQLKPGRAGVRKGDAMIARRGLAGKVTLGPGASLPTGSYELRARVVAPRPENAAAIEVSPERKPWKKRAPLRAVVRSKLKHAFGARRLKFEVVCGHQKLSSFRMPVEELRSGELILPFCVDLSAIRRENGHNVPSIEFKVSTNGHAVFSLEDVQVRMLEPGKPSGSSLSAPPKFEVHND